MVRAGDVTNAAREINRHNAQIVPSPKPRLSQFQAVRTNRPKSSWLLVSNFETANAQFVVTNPVPGF
jgi:hypothetical protein